ncbi:hypothetical protein BGZ74_007602 [Mortierella antarctica]|nr:hypothetical protein BGZ74_007602 [Mortierella antarctica]KAG0362591.1 hypothetical protein BG005_004938 [Podila minutissima]
MAPIHRIAQISSHLVRAHAPASRLLSASLERNLTLASSTFTPTKKDRAFYSYAIDIQSRWADNDQYGHLNNAHYYALFDTVINTFLIQETGLNPHDDQAGTAIGVVAESGCQYFSSVSFPDMIEARLAVVKLGRSSVVYQVGIFKKQSEESSSSPSSSLPKATGTHVASSKGGVGRFLVPEASAGLARGDAAASGHFCHVFVDKTSRRPVAIPASIRAGLEKLKVASSE